MKIGEFFTFSVRLELCRTKKFSILSFRERTLLVYNPTYLQNFYLGERSIVTKLLSENNLRQLNSHTLPEPKEITTFLTTFIFFLNFCTRATCSSCSYHTAPLFLQTICRRVLTHEATWTRLSRKVGLFICSRYRVAITLWSSVSPRQ